MPPIELSPGDQRLRAKDAGAPPSYDGAAPMVYSELKGMDLAEYREAVEAKLLYMEKWLPEAREKAKSRQ